MELTRTNRISNAKRPSLLCACSFGIRYDALDRINSGTKTGTTRGWTYDANGNRLTETGSAASTYTVSSTNNRVSSITGALPRSYTYDNAGDVLTYSTITATYNMRGRMATLKKGTVTESLTYNALGQMISTSGGAMGTELIMYDEAGLLIGEYGASGTLIQETIWLGDIPVATIRPSGSTVAIYYVHTDVELHGCGAPRKCSDGCVAATTNYDSDLLNYDLGLEEGFNRLMIVP